MNGYKKIFNCNLKTCKVCNIEKSEVLTCKGCKANCKRPLQVLRQPKIHKEKQLEINFNNENCREIKTSQSSRYFLAGNYKIFWNIGNSKVKVPIINVGTATNCSSKEFCGFHISNYKSSGFPMCYACRDELLYKPVMASRLCNEENLKNAYNNNDSYNLGIAIGKRIATYCVSKSLRFVRLNESGDLASWNINFITGICNSLELSNIRAWIYTKQLEFAKLLPVSNLTILESQKDFVCVKTLEEAVSRGLKMCPGVECGVNCLWCPTGLQTAVLEH